VLKGVDFDAKHGDVTMVMGPSGSGKSTLVAALSGLLKPDEGKVAALEAADLWKLSPARSTSSASTTAASSSRASTCSPP
jgi:putative ABC transport system ATP-binding protein